MEAKEVKNGQKNVKKDTDKEMKHGDKCDCMKCRREQIKSKRF